MGAMDDLHKVHGELPLKRNDPASLSDRYTIDNAIVDALAALNGPKATDSRNVEGETTIELFPDPFTSDHHFEYWIWTGSRLVPASPEQAERLRQQEALEAEEFRRLRESQRAYRVQLWQPYRRILHWPLALLHNLANETRTLSSRARILTRRS
jgi:hypothetical protein